MSSKTVDIKLPGVKAGYVGKSSPVVSSPVVTNIHDFPMDVAFPNVDSGHSPFGSRVIVQIRTPRRVSKGGIHIPEEVRDTDQWNTQIAVVRSIGPYAFHFRDSGKPWPEGPWFKVGDFVRVPKYNQDRWTVPLDNGDEAHFMMLQEYDILAAVTVDPRTIKAFI